MGRIRLLSAELVNKIAAGEVVERPASVVKELAENSVDAGAKNVRVLVADGGLGAITIIDDGHGMSRADARLSLERHATSKLFDDAGLFRITTKGFRGEALPSIASVSRFTLSTSEPDAVEGTRIVVEGGGAPLVEPCAPLGGTRIDVAELFFNTPARRKFLKRETTELVHCEEAVIRLALAHPAVGFFMEHSGRRLFSSPGVVDPRERIMAALGPEVGPHLLEISDRRLGLSVSGFVASPEFTLNTARGLYTLVNRRYIRDRGLNGAVQRAFQDSLPPGRQPVAVIFIELDPGEVDVNVHPQKLEVRFADPRAVQEVVGAAISRALKAAPWRNAPSQPVASEAGAHYAQAIERFLARAQPAPAFFEQPPAMALDGEARPGFGTAHPGLNDAPPPGYFTALRFVGVLSRRFWICEAPGGTLVVVDPRAVYERVHLHRLSERLEAGALATAQPTLFTARLELPPAVVTALVDAGLTRFGIELEPFGGATVAVRRVPIELEPADLTAFFGALAGVVADDGEVLRLMASTASAVVERDVSPDAAHRWLTWLDDADFSAACDHGRVVLHEVPLLDLERRAL